MSPSRRRSGELITSYFMVGIAAAFVMTRLAVLRKWSLRRGAVVSSAVIACMFALPSAGCYLLVTLGRDSPARILFLAGPVTLLVLLGCFLGIMKLRARGWRFQFSLAALISFVIFVNLGFAIWYTWDNYYYPAPMQVLRGHERMPFGAKFSPDGTRVISYDSHSIRLWDIKSGKELQGLKRQRPGISGIAVSPDGKSVAYGDYRGNIHIWTPWSEATIKKFSGHASWPVNSIEFSSDGKRMLSSVSIDNTIILWDVESAKEIARFTTKEYRNGTNQVVFMPDRRQMLSVGMSGGLLPAQPDFRTIVLLWDTETGDMIRKYGGAGRWGLPVAFSPDRRQVLASGGLASTEMDIVLWDMEKDREIRKLRGHTAFVNFIDFSGDGGRVLSGSPDHTIRLWDTRTGEELKRIRMRTSTLIKDFLPDGRLAVTNDLTDTLKIWDLSRSPSPWPLILSISATIAFALFVIVMKIRARRKARAAASAEGDAHA